jgi:tetratricopeptide (TPR) repeat protein
MKNTTEHQVNPDEQVIALYSDIQQSFDASDRRKQAVAKIAAFTKNGHKTIKNHAARILYQGLQVLYYILLEDKTKAAEEYEKYNKREVVPFSDLVYTIYRMCDHEILLPEFVARMCLDGIRLCRGRLTFRQVLTKIYLQELRLDDALREAEFTREGLDPKDDSWFSFHIIFGRIYLRKYEETGNPRFAREARKSYNFALNACDKNVTKEARNMLDFIPADLNEEKAKQRTTKIFSARANMLLNKLGTQIITSDKRSELLRLLELAKQYDPDPNHPKALEARFYHLTHKYGEALALANEILNSSTELSPDVRLVALSCKSYALSIMGTTEEAITTYKELIPILGSEDQYSFRTNYCAMLSKAYSKIATPELLNDLVNESTILVNAYPNDEQALLLYCRACIKAKKWPELQAPLNKLITIAPNIANYTCFVEAYLQMFANDFITESSAVSILNKTLNDAEGVKDLPAFKLLVGSLYIFSNNFDKAQTLSNELVQSKATRVEGYILRYEILKMQSKFSEALAQIKEAFICNATYCLKYIRSSELFDILVMELLEDALEVKEKSSVPTSPQRRLSPTLVTEPLTSASSASACEGSSTSTEVDVRASVAAKLPSSTDSTHLATPQRRKRLSSLSQEEAKALCNTVTKPAIAIEAQPSEIIWDINGAKVSQYDANVHEVDCYFLPNMYCYFNPDDPAFKAIPARFMESYKTLLEHPSIVRADGKSGIKYLKGQEDYCWELKPKGSGVGNTRILGHNVKATDNRSIMIVFDNYKERVHERGLGR